MFRISARTLTRRPGAIPGSPGRIAEELNRRLCEVLEYIGESIVGIAMVLAALRRKRTPGSIR